MRYGKIVSKTQNCWSDRICCIVCPIWNGQMVIVMVQEMVDAYVFLDFETDEDKIKLDIKDNTWFED